MPSDDIIALPFDDYNAYEIAEQPFIVDKLIVGGGIHLVYGREDVGKTQFLFTMIRDILNGERFLGRYDTTPCRIAYFSVDMPHIKVQERTRLLDGEITNPDDLLVVSKDNSINVVDLANSLEGGEPPSWLRRVWTFEPDVIFIDTLHKIHLLDENASWAVTAVFKAMKQVFGSHISYVIAHHAGKESANPQHTKKDRDKQRGSSAWLSDADLGIMLEESIEGGGRKERRVVVRFPRVRYCEEQTPIKTKTNPETMTLETLQGTLTASEHAKQFLKKNPDASLKSIADWVMREKGFAQSTAYEAAHEALNEV